MQFRDLSIQYQKLKQEIDQRIAEVCKSSAFISGPNVRGLEKELADYVGVKHCITCANGTDAITLAIRAWELGENDAVFIPDFTFFSSGECPAREGCKCVFVDVDKYTYNISPTKLEEAIQRVIDEGRYEAKAVIAVDLFGQPADYPAIRKICDKYGLLLLEDGAQGFGGRIGDKRACSFGDISTTSFFPAKPLGCYGDGGAIFTDNDNWAELIRSYAVHGKAFENKYDNIRLGYNSRLDTIQAAILQVKFKAFRDYEVDSVNHIAKIYNKEIHNSKLETKITIPDIKEGFTSSWAQYTIQLSDDIDRDKLQLEMRGKGIPTMVYYPKPMHTQGAFSGTGSDIVDCRVTEELCKKVLSLPMHPYMQETDVQLVISALKSSL